jgi:2,5-diamino-6-(ribosylamino)-4(3H)-pyrimidinone 5'-phosphate reductase
MPRDPDRRAQLRRPRVTIHAMTGLDGRTDHFAGDIGQFYAVAGRIPHDAVLSGSATFAAAAAAEGVDLADEDPTPADRPRPATHGDDARPLLVIVDSGGRITRFAWLVAVPFWREVVVACTSSTPPAHLDRLDRLGIRRIVAGEDRVDLGGLLERLASDEGIERVRVDSGGTLNGALLRAGLVDEVSLLLGPWAVGGRTPAGLFVADDLPDDAVTRFRLVGVERLDGDVAWLRYETADA